MGVKLYYGGFDTRNAAEWNPRSKTIHFASHTTDSDLKHEFGKISKQEWDEVLERNRIFRCKTLITVAQAFYAVQHANGQAARADRTEVVVKTGFFRRQAHIALAVSVIVVFSLLGIEFNRV